MTKKDNTGKKIYPPQHQENKRLVKPNHLEFTKQTTYEHPINNKDYYEKFDKNKQIFSIIEESIHEKDNFHVYWFSWDKYNNWYTCLETAWVYIENTMINSNASKTHIKTYTLDAGNFQLKHYLPEFVVCFQQ